MPPRDFNPRPPRGGRPLLTVFCRSSRVFQSTPPARGATVQNPIAVFLVGISIHAPREGGRQNWRSIPTCRASFQSTPPARGATSDPRQAVTGLDISIHAPREGGDKKSTKFSDCFIISIHAPREGGDDTKVSDLIASGISIHAPREGGDRPPSRRMALSLVFQSTPPARGATAKMHSLTCGSLTNK